MSSVVATPGSVPARADHWRKQETGLWGGIAEHLHLPLVGRIADHSLAELIKLSFDWSTFRSDVF